MTSGSLNDFLTLARGLRRLWPILRVPRKLLALVIFSSFLAGLLEGVGVGLLLPLLELLRSNASSQPSQAIQLITKLLPGYSQTVYVISLCALVLIAIALKNAALYWGSQISAQMRAVALLNLRDAIFSRLQNSDLSVFESSTSGEMANGVLIETGRTAYALEFLTLLVQRFAITFCYALSLVFISWQLSLLALLVGILCAVSLRSIYNQLAQMGRDLGSVGDRVGSHLIESLAGTRLIRATNSQPREQKRFYDLNVEWCAALRESVRAGGMLSPVTEVVGVLGGMSIIGFAAVFLVQTGRMSGDMLLGFAFVLVRLLPIATQLYAIYGQIISLAGGVEQSIRWAEVPLFPQRSFGDKTFPGLRREIDIRGLSYAYPNGTRALNNVSFTIPAGKMIALVGSSGSGKSTIAALLLRLREPTSGQISVDGEDYWNFSAASWHRKVAIVEQEAFLFNASLKQNICYGYEDASERDVSEAIRKAHLTQVIAELDHGVETVVGERGATLSGGQRQRMSIARALVRNPEILVLDEATSALDSVSEAQVQQAIDEAQSGRTVVVIAHRFSTIRRADHIVVLERGRVVEQGSWDELEARQGAFYSLLNVSQKALV